MAETTSTASVCQSRSTAWTADDPAVKRDVLAEQLDSITDTGASPVFIAGNNATQS